MEHNFFWEKLPAPRAYKRGGRFERSLGIAHSFYLRNKKTIIPIALFLTLTFIYIMLHLTFINQRAHYINVADGDEPGYLMVTDSLVKDHDLSPLNNYLQLDYLKLGFYQQQMKYPENRPMLIYGTGGRMVYSNARLLPFLLYPGFALFGYFGAVLTISLLMSGGALLTYLIARRFCRNWISLLATLSFFLTYPAIAYSRRVYPEPAALFFLTLALWASLRLKESGNPSYALLAGICASLLFQFHLKFAPLVLPLFYLAWLTSKRKKIEFPLWIAPVIISLGFALLWTKFLFGGGTIQGLTKTVSPENLGGAPFWGFIGLYLDRGLGLLPFAPLYLIFIPGLPLPRDRHELNKWWCFIPACIIVHTLSMGWFGQWHGGASPVPRYLIPLIPILALCASFFLEKLRNFRIWCVVLFLLCLEVVLSIFAFIYPLETFGVSWHKNRLLPIVFGKWFGNFIASLFPTFHPLKFSSGILPLIIWLLLMIFGSIYLRKKEMGYFYERLT